MRKVEIEDVALLLRERGVAGESDLCGCSLSELEAVEEKLGKPIPLAYRNFLKIMGRGAGRLFLGTNAFFPGILELTEIAAEIVSEDPSHIKLPEDALVLTMHQGYEFMFMRKSEGDDPPVYHYLEGRGGFDKRQERFTEYLSDAALDDR
jgi:hypothetical protein